MLQSFNARTQEAFYQPLASTSDVELNAAVQFSKVAFDSWQSSDGETRAKLLEALAEALEADREKLVELADIETGLGPIRLNGELDHVCW